MTALQLRRWTQGILLQGRGLMLLLLLTSCVADDSQPRSDKEGFGIGDYEYHYDELPREHLARFGRAAGGGSHIQHVPADAPRVSEDAAGATAIQRVPRREPDAAAEAPTAEAPAVPAEPAPVPGSAAAAAAAFRVSSQAQAPEPAAELEPPPNVESAEGDFPAQQATQVPATVPTDKLAKEDMETANFFWGLGPVYPHLYVYRRVPHLVPLHGWSPYHAYLLTHPSK